MGTKDNKTNNGECRRDTHLSNTECKMVKAINVLKNLTTLTPSLSSNRSQSQNSIACLTR